MEELDWKSVGLPTYVSYEAYFSTLVKIKTDIFFLQQSLMWKCLQYVNVDDPAKNNFKLYSRLHD